MGKKGKILLTGANGYIGRRLLPVLLDKGYHVICMVRDPRRFSPPGESNGKIEIISGDLLVAGSLFNIPSDIDAAYYLVHSMNTTGEEFIREEKRQAENFRNYLDHQTSCRQIIFLSGINNEEKELSPHFKSRKIVEETLNESDIPLTTLRAAIIVGSGSASFEIIRDLVEKLPVMVAPKWLNNRIQPIAIRDVLQYLKGVLFEERAFNKTFDIGGPDILTYRKLLEIYAEVRDFYRVIINVPVLTPRLSSYWLYFITSTSYPLARNLVESLKHNVVVQKKGIEDIVPINATPYKEAVELAFRAISEKNVISSWKDSIVSGKIHKDFLDKSEVPDFGVFRDHKEAEIKTGIPEAINKLWKIGGSNGWYGNQGLWTARGILDKTFGGVGLSRGRRSDDELQSGDALDFWRVIKADKEKGELLLYAEMKLPGEAWLEFRIAGSKGKPTLLQTATFRPRGVTGRLYWYSLLPFHNLIFRRMAENIAS